MAHFDARGPHCLELSGNSPFGHMPVISMSLSPWIRKSEGSTTVSDIIVAYTSHEYAGLRRLSVREYIDSDAEVNVKVNSHDIGSYCGWIGPGSSIKWDSQVRVLEMKNLHVANHDDRHTRMTNSSSVECFLHHSH